MPAQVLGVAPILLVKSVTAAAKYWEEKVGFSATLFHDPPTFALVSRDATVLMLAQVGPGTQITPNWRLVGKTCDAYIWVDDAAAIYQELIERGASIDFTLYETPWGTKEFGIQDIDDHDIAFGQVIRS